MGSKSGVSKSIPVWTAAVPDQLSIGDDPDENYYNASTLTSSEFCIGLSSFTMRLQICLEAYLKGDILNPTPGHDKA